jgi:threonine dehydratase
VIDPEACLAPDAIRAARDRIAPVFLDSPQFVHDGLSARAGVPVVVKIETVNPIGSFKGRGTWHAVGAMVGEGSLARGRPVVAASSGNFGQGLAFAGRAHGIPVTIFAELHANARKVERMRGFGARVIEGGRDFDEARVAAEAHAAEIGASLLIDGEDPRIAAGAGTMAVELTEAVARGELPEPVAAYVPVGNGALIVGVGAWLRHAAPACRVMGIQSEGAPAMTLSWRAGRPIETERAATYAGGIQVRVPVPEALDQMAGRVDDMRLVSEEALHEAQAELTGELGVTVEGAGAASWAGLLAGPRPDGPALVIVTGSNV